MNSRKHVVFFSALMLGIALLGSVEAKGPRVKVEAAIPSEAEQGQQNKPVKIKGQNFRAGDTVHFLVAGTDDESQIDVLAVVYDPDTGDLDTVINVDDLATVTTYDIEVRRSGGRGGKGTELFSVKLKGGGNGDTTPPAPIDDFRVQDPVFSNSVTLLWTSPGDDGNSGSVDHYVLRQAIQASAAICESQGPYDFSAAELLDPPPNSPAGWLYTFPVDGLTPESCYAFELEAFDDVGLSSGPAFTSALTVSAPSLSGWRKEEFSTSAYHIQMAFDPRTNEPVVLGGNLEGNSNEFFERLPGGGWVRTPLNKSPGENLVSLAFNPVGNHFGAVVLKRGRPHYAEQQADGSWNMTQLSRDAAWISHHAIYFDPDGNAVITFNNNEGFTIARQNGAGFDFEDNPFSPNMGHIMRMDPATGHPVLLSFDYETINIAEFDVSTSAWSVSTLTLGSPETEGDDLNVLDFDFDPNGEMFIIYQQEEGVGWEFWAKMIRRDSAGNWDTGGITYVDPDGLLNQNVKDVVVASDGTIYGSGTNTTNQAKVGKFCEAGRGFACTPTMDALGNNVWIWEILEEGIGQHGRYVAYDEATGKIALIATSSEPPAFLYYYECDPDGPSPICGSAP